MSCGPSRSLANSLRRASVQVFAPERHAWASGTMWSMSRSEASVKSLLSYSLCQVPEMARQFSSCLTSAPSRASTTSRVSQELPC